jgi:hypothetical protein
LNDYDFSAKANFLKSISQRFTTNITAQIETTRKARTANKQKAATAGENLYKNTRDDLSQLKGIFGAQDFSYSNVADKVANEILQCSIDFFNDSQDKELENNYHEKAVNLAKLAQGIAVGSVAKDRIKENLQTLEEMKDREILQAIALLQQIKNSYQTLGYNQYIRDSAINDLLKEAFTDEFIKKVSSSTEEQLRTLWVLFEFLLPELSNRITLKKILDKFYKYLPKISSTRKTIKKKVKSICFFELKWSWWFKWLQHIPLLFIIAFYEVPIVIAYFILSILFKSIKALINKDQ